MNNYYKYNTELFSKPCVGNENIELLLNDRVAAKFKSLVLYGTTDETYLTSIKLDTIEILKYPIPGLFFSVSDLDNWSKKGRN